jgi:hypothetical protein
MCLILAFVLVQPLVFLRPVEAAEKGSNNKFGIHLAVPQTGDLRSAAELVNSAGGDWGYVTLVIQEDDRDVDKWQEIFDFLREHHLIPIIRLATKPDGASWKRPEKEEAENWASFLNSLNWVVKDRYVILFNEPNHAAEWGGAVDPEDFADRIVEYARKIKEKNPDFVLMMAGFDASAPSQPPQYESEDVYLRKVLSRITPSEFEKLFSGWSSHSYPNPGFSGSPYDSGRGTVKTYQWELELLKNLGVDKSLLVFITETGWSDRNVSREMIAWNFRYAFANIWLVDSRVVAVTPFVFDYQGEPFIGFSWKKYQANISYAEAAEGKNYHLQYYTVQSMSKVKGDPEIEEGGELVFNFPKALVTNSSYNFKIKIKNSGQAVWDKDAGYYLGLDGQPEGSYLFSDLKKIKPFEETEVNLYLKTGNQESENRTKIAMFKNGRKILEAGNWNFVVKPLPSLEFRVMSYPKLKTEGEDFELQIFDDQEALIFKKRGLKVKRGTGYADDIQNIILEKKYRIVLLRPYYLPRQQIIFFKEKTNRVWFEKMIPIDFNADGSLNFEDLSSLFVNPRLLKLLFP